jgi:hypothetical protein
MIGKLLFLYYVLKKIDFKSLFYNILETIDLENSVSVTEESALFL